MIGKYADEEFFEKLTTKEQREYLVSLVKICQMIRQKNYMIISMM